MSILSQSSGLLFRIDADASQAQRELKGIDAAVGSLGGKFGSFGGIASVAAVGVAAIAAAAVTGAVALFNLTKSAAEYGSVIFDAKEKTGLSAASLSTLKLAADNAGSSLDQVTSGAAKFAKTLGQARDGSKEAQAKLAALGVTSYDLDTALSQATNTIFKAKNGTDQIVLSQKAFGKSGADLIPVIKQLGGDLAAATKEGIRLGTTLTEKDIVAADAFGDALGLLSSQAKAASVAFTSDLMPVLTRFFTSTSEWYARNQNEVRAWGTTTAVIMGDVARTVGIVFNAIMENATRLRIALAAVSLGMSELAFWASGKVIEIVATRVANVNAANKLKPQEGLGQAGVTSGFPTGGGTGGSGKGGGGGGKSKAASEAERKATDEVRAQLELQKIALDELEDKYKKVMARVREEFEKTGDAVAFANAANAANRELADGLPAVLDALDQIERKLLKDPTATQLQVLAKQQNKRRAAIEELAVEDVDKNNARITDSHKKAAEQRLEIEKGLERDLEAVRGDIAANIIQSTQDYYEEEIKNAVGNFELQNRLRGEAYNAIKVLSDAELQRKKQLLDLEEEDRRDHIKKTIKDETAKLIALAQLRELFHNKALLAEEEFRIRLKAIEDSFAIPVTDADDQVGGFAGGFLGGLGSSIEELLAPVDKMNQLGQMLGATFSQVAQAVGEAVRSFVLFGSAGGSFRKFAAEVIASIAQMSVVQAVYQLALGLAALALTWFTGNPKYAKAAGGHFASAAMFGMIGGVAAIAGRAVAGDSFKQQTNTATGGASASGGQGTSTAGGSVYSSQPNQIVESGRNAPGGFNPVITLNIRTRDSHIVEVIRDNVNRLGSLRTVIQQAG